MNGIVAQTNTYAPEFWDISFVDQRGDPIILRIWEYDDSLSIRAYDLHQAQPPEKPHTGQAGYANARLEKGPDGRKVVRLQVIVTLPEYRLAGIGRRMLGLVEQYGLQNGALEIYGAIENPHALAFWLAQAKYGWSVTIFHGGWGEVRKHL